MNELDPGKDISLFRINIVFLAAMFFILSYIIEVYTYFCFGLFKIICLVYIFM